MFILILGSGRIGVSLARHLVAAGHEIGVIERDDSRCAVLEEELGSVSVLGDGTEIEVLSKAGAIRADMFVATTSNDEDNLAACQIVSHRFGVNRTFSIVNHPEHARLFDLLGVQVSIDVTELTVSRIQELMFLDGLVQLMPMPGDQTRSLVAIRIPRESPMNGRPLGELLLPNGASISLVIGKDGSTEVPEETSVIRGDDDIMAIADSQDQELLRNMLVEQLGEVD